MALLCLIVLLLSLLAGGQGFLSFSVTGYLDLKKQQQQLCNLASGAAGLSGAATAAVAGVGAVVGAAAESLT